jgi:hypothetical protein
VAEGDEVPAASGVGPGERGAEPPVAAVEVFLRVLEVDVVDAVTEVPGETGAVQVLPGEVAGVEVEPGGGAVADGLQGTPGGPVVVGGLAGVHVGGGAHAFGVEDIEDGVPALVEVLVAAFDGLGRYGREHGHGVPDG